jgi:hypothetical protein
VVNKAVTITAIPSKINARISKKITKFQYAYRRQSHSFGEITRPEQVRYAPRIVVVRDKQ